ncbi:MAG: flagellar biosynthetic protein FliR [Deltaproteobacteria bacterium]|nr:flagellar biosynthetic protein FliR [Deltaproteobacteria bacterium]
MDNFINHLIKVLSEEFGQGHALILFSLIAARMMTLVSLVPFLGSRNAPGPVKMGVGLMLAGLMWPIATAQVDANIPLSLAPYLLMIMKEVFVGFTIGFVTAQVFYAVEMAGQAIDIVRATNQVMLIVPEITDRSSPYGDIYYQVALILFLASGFHGIFFDGIVQSFISVPITEFPKFSAGSAHFYQEFMMLAAEIFRIAITLALPIIAVCIMINLSFGLINRIAPQINAYFLSMPALATGGMAISLFALSMTFSQFEYFSAKLMGTYMKIILLMG